MGFRHGEGNEKLLSCTNCLAAMEIDAKFCVECGTKRTEAITGRTSKSTSSTSQNEESQKDVSENILTVESDSELKPPKVKRDPKLRIALARLSERSGIWLRKRAKFVFTIAGISIAIGVYGILQTFIFTSSNPESFAKEYIQAVVDRDASKVEEDSQLFPNPQKLPILPKQFQKWDSIDGLTWKTYSEWNGWSGSGFVNFVPMDGNSIKKDLEFTLQIKANYKSKFGMFREIEWSAAEPMASISIMLANEKDIGISINQVPAGSVDKPVLAEKKYLVFPGPLKVALTGAGFTKKRESDLFFGSSSNTDLSFPKIEYNLSSSQVSDARVKLENSLVSCLKRECSDLPRLSQFDFSFSNQPTDYLYTDYFYVDWSDEPSCSVANYSASSADKGNITLSCTAYAYGSIKWILYRIWLTTYYDTGFDSATVPLTVSAKVSRTSNPYKVELSNIQISG